MMAEIVCGRSGQVKPRVEQRVDTHTYTHARPPPVYSSVTHAGRHVPVGVGPLLEVGVDADLDGRVGLARGLGAAELAVHLVLVFGVGGGRACGCIYKCVCA